MPTSVEVTFPDGVRVAIGEAQPSDDEIWAAISAIVDQPQAGAQSASVADSNKAPRPTARAVYYQEKAKKKGKRA